MVRLVAWLVNDFPYHWWGGSPSNPLYVSTGLLVTCAAWDLFVLSEVNGFSLFLWLWIEQQWIRGHGVVVHDWYHSWGDSFIDFELRNKLDGQPLVFYFLMNHLWSISGCCGVDSNLASQSYENSCVWGRTLMVPPHATNWMKSSLIPSVERWSLILIHSSELDYIGSMVLTVASHLMRVTTAPCVCICPRLANLVASMEEEQKNRALSSPKGRSVGVTTNEKLLLSLAILLSSLSLSGQSQTIAICHLDFSDASSLSLCG